MNMTNKCDSDMTSNSRDYSYFLPINKRITKYLWRYSKEKMFGNCLKQDAHCKYVLKICTGKI